MIGTIRHIWIAAALGVAALGPAGARAQPPRLLDDLRRASVSWDLRPGPARRVVDQVALVPDLPAFLEAVAAWDEGHWFPVLIEDVELSAKFLRAFKPARIVRPPGRSAPIEAARRWERAISAVGRAWAKTSAEDDARGDAPPAGLGPTPPGVVLSAPDSPSLAGAVALAAGRFQPLVRWEPEKHYADILTDEEARALALDLEAKVAGCVPRHDKLGDLCDFLTLAGDWPYRYRDKDGGLDAFDDLIGRSADFRSRWAYAGRLLGDPVSSAYRAMCSLFLQPGSALLFNTYDESGQPWAQYAMPAAEERLARLVPVEHRAGARATLAGWHEAFDPVNRYGLVLINTHGQPTQFHVNGGTAYTCDVPLTAPTALLMIHSFSAADPNDPATIAGRWLANGAFVYFGSVHEPFLQAFRPPSLVAALAAEGLPLGAVARQSPPEPFGKPWRLIYLGDPLYRLQAENRARLADWEPVARWPRLKEPAPPAATATDDARLTWAAQAVLARLQREPSASGPRGDLLAIVQGITRDRLDASRRPTYDALLGYALVVADRPEALAAALARRPAAEWSPADRRHWEWCQTTRLQVLLARRDIERALALWSETIRVPADREFLDQVTIRVGSLADDPLRRTAWRDRLRAVHPELAEKSPAAEVVAAERKRVEDQLNPPQGKP